MAHHLRVPLNRYAEFPVRVFRRLDKAVQRPSGDSQGAGVGDALVVAGIPGNALAQDAGDARARFQRSRPTKEQNNRSGFVDVGKD